MGLRNTHKTDNTLETEGVRIEVDVNEHNGEPIAIILARMGKTNKAYTKELDKVTKPHMAAIQNETMPIALGDKLIRGVFARTVLKGWENLPLSEFTGNDKDTELVPFSPEKALELFDALPGVYDDWEERAKKTANFREEERKTAAKN